MSRESISSDSRSNRNSSSKKGHRDHDKGKNSAKRTPRKIIKKPPRKYSDLKEIRKKDVMSRIKPIKELEKNKELLDKNKDAANRIDSLDIL